MLTEYGYTYSQSKIEWIEAGKQESRKEKNGKMIENEKNVMQET